jgi:prevent-host-death family protein
MYCVTQNPSGGLWLANENARAAELFPLRRDANLLSMVRRLPLKPTAKAARPERPPLGRRRLQDAKARFSEFVRLTQSEGPQHVTLHGRDAVVVVDAAEFHRMKRERTGQLLIDALQALPHRDVEIATSRSAMPVRAVKL